MKILIFDNSAEATARVTVLLAEAVRRKFGAVLGLATGATIPERQFSALPR